LPSLANKVFLVTGGTAGIGFGISAHILAHNPGKLYILSRNPSHAATALKDLKKYGDTGKVEWVQCDLGCLKSVDVTARWIRRECPRLDSIIANAGLGVGKFGLSADGIEHHFQVNHLSHQHLILTLLPLLLSTATPRSPTRITLQSSSLHAYTPPSTRFLSLAEINTDLGPTHLYNRSKLANLLFMRGLLSRRLDLKEKGVLVNCTHPGAVRTGQQEQAVEAYGEVTRVLERVVRWGMKDPVEEGCSAALWAGVGEEVGRERVSGVYVTPPNRISQPDRMAGSVELRENLWRLSEELLKEKLG
ncbi:NAD(P)-binding protein, partial [Ascodesmis nigricans]